MRSSATGAQLTGTELNPDYWYQSLRHPVQFEQATRALLDDNTTTFIEISPHPVLTTPIQQTTDHHTHNTTTTIPTLHRNQHHITPALAEAWTHGLPVDWRAVYPPGAPLDLPTYPFQRRRYWLDQRAAVDGKPDPADAALWELVEREDREALAATLALDVDQASAVLPALSAWRRRAREEATLDRLRYRVGWKPLAAAPGARLAGTWLVVAPQTAGGAVAAVVAALERHGAEVVRLELDARETGREHLAHRIRTELARASPVAGVASLLALDERPHADQPTVPCGFATTLALLQALGDAGVDAPLWCATSGAVSTGPSDRVARPLQALAWGLGAVAALEQPRRWGGLVDLPQALDERTGAALATLLAGDSGEDQVALRPSGAVGRRLTRAPADRRRARGGWRPRGTTLITGASGALGAHIARWLARAGAPRLVLASRRGSAAPGADALARELGDLGARVSIVACDVADADAVADLLAGVPDEHPISAVVHAAGVGAAGALDSVTLGDAAEVLRAKVGGALVLDRLLGEQPLDAFVVFSSLSGICGAGGLGAYAAANAFLDALVDHRRARGLAGTAVAWGRWAGEGMAAAAGEAFGRRGLAAMEAATATRALEQALAADDAALAVADVDWDRFHAALTVARPSPLLADLPEVRALERSTRAESLDGNGGDPLGGPLAELPQAERRRVLLDLVRREAAAVLGHDTPEAVEPARDFRDAGLDSLSAVELRKRLSAATGLRLSTSLAFEHPTAAEVAAHLDETLAAGGAARSNGSAPRALVSLYREGHASGRAAAATAMIAAAAQLRETFAAAADAGSRPRPVTFSSGELAPDLICFPSATALSTALQFVRFARAFEGARSVRALSLIGFAAGERLPASTTALAELLADEVERLSEGRPAVLVGYCSGGWVAHSVARALDARGKAPAGLAFLDMYAPSPQLVEDRWLVDSLLERERMVDGFDDARLTAMAAYLGLFADWTPEPLPVPTLFVPARGSEGATLARYVRPSPAPARRVEVPGDHFSIIEDDAGAAAAAVEQWLSDSWPARARESATVGGPSS